MIFVYQWMLDAYLVQYADEIAQAINDQERYESGDVDTY
jgi:hypothetical protein